MATIYLTLSAKSGKNPQKEIRIRFKHGRIDQQCRTDVFIPEEYWEGESQQIIVPNFRLITPERNQLISYLSAQKERLNRLIHVIQNAFNISDKESITNGWLKQTVERFNFPDRYEPKKREKQSFFDLFDEFLQKRKLSKAREINFISLKRILQRYEMYVRERCVFSLDIDSITAETIEDFERFLRNEHTLYDEYKDLYDRFPSITHTKQKSLRPQPRGGNTVNAIFNRLRAFYNWCLDNDKTDNRPFRRYKGVRELYGTPYYISIEERNQIYNAELSEKLSVQRDIFVFQCLTGCRVSDLYRLTKASIINGAVEYIPHKTKEGHPVTLRIPLNDTAKEILRRYESFKGSALFPFVCKQKYNYAIKEIFRLSCIRRTVTVLNPTTREEEKRPICEIASSHIARRTFIGNLYKKVKDPNLVGSLSGHKEGSKVFARYRDIDEEMKTELVALLE